VSYALEDRHYKLGSYELGTTGATTAAPITATAGRRHDHGDWHDHDDRHDRRD
jgi:hypothetical protein